MTYLEEMREAGREVRARLGLWKPFEPVKWRPPPKETPEAVMAAARARRNARRMAIVERIEAERGIYSERAKGMRPGARIVLEVARKHGLSLTEIKAHRRPRHIVLARQEAAWRMTQETSLSLPQIGAILGGFDHTTVLHAIRRHEARLAGEKYVR